VDNFKNKLVTGFAWQASTKLFVQIFSWISTIWVARLLVPEDYGLVAISGLIVGIFIMLATTGFAAGAVNRVNISKGELDTVFWLSMFLGGLLYGLIFFIADFAAQYYEEDKLSDVIKVAGLMVLICAAKIVPSALALRALDFKAISLNEMFGAFVGIIVTLSMAMMGYEYWSLIAGTIASEVFTTLIYYILYRYVPSLTFKIETVSDLLYFGITLLFASGFKYVSGNIPVLLLSMFTNTGTIGHYQMAHTFGSLPSKKVGSLFSNLIFPAMSRIKSDKTLAKNTFIQMHTSLLFVTGPMFIGLALVAEPFINVILTPAWLPIIVPFQLVCIIAIFQMSSLFITRTIEGLGDAKVTLKYQIYTIIICGSAMFSGIYLSGLNGMLTGWLLSSPIVYLYLLIKVATKLEIKWQEMLKMFLPLSLCLFFMCASVLLMMHFAFEELSYLQQLVFASLTGSIVFCVAAYIFARQYVIKVNQTVFKVVGRGFKRAD
jgi:O-antigen/teichoic acid export membrane protein